MPPTPRLVCHWSQKWAKTLLCACIIVFFCPALLAQPGGKLITTIAGLGDSAFSGDGGPALYSGLTFPTSLALDSLSNLYITDRADNRVRKVTPQGIISTVAGDGVPGFSGDGGAGIAASLSSPGGVAADTSGNVYLADSGNNRIRRVTPQGIISTVAGNGVKGFSGDGGPATAASLSYPQGLAVDTYGNLYIADSGNSRIRKVTPQGIINTVAGSTVRGFRGDGGAATVASLSDPSGLCLDLLGNLYIVDSGNSRIRKVTPPGIISTVAGNGFQGFSGDGGPATAAQFTYPSGIAVDSSGDLFVVDTGNCAVRKVTYEGIISTDAACHGSLPFGDGGPAAAAGLQNPRGVAIDAKGDLYVADGNTIRRLLASPAVGVGCAYSLDQGGQRFASAGGASSVGVLATLPGCPWLAISHDDWIVTNGGGIQSGLGVVTYTVSPNLNTAQRSGSIWIAGQGVNVYQSGVECLLSVAPRSLSVAASGLTGGSISIASNAPDCRWTTTATASVPWILVSGGGPGAGGGAVTFTVGVNTGGQRTGTITAAGQKVYVNQAAAGTSISSLASITAPGVVNAASFSPPISPGSFVTVYGQNLADTTTDWSAAIKNRVLPTSLGGVQVLIDRNNAFIYYVSPTQVNAIAPPDTASGSVEVDVITTHGTVPAFANLVPISPELFTYSLRSAVYASALFNSDGAYVASVGSIPGAVSRPAQAGDYIVLYATGLGATSPPYPVGQVLTTAYPVQSLSKVSVLIAGKPAKVLFAGMTYPGLFQINLQVPDGIPAGDQPVVLGVAGQTSVPRVYVTFGGG